MQHKIAGYIGLIFYSFLFACSPAVNIGKAVNKQLLQQPALKAAHTGISIYDVAEKKYLYNYQGDKYFVPASNTKLFSLYAGMKYLGDSLPGIQYAVTADTFFIYPTGDPTLLHPDFKKQRVIEQLQQTTKTIVATTANWQDEALGYGWSWDDYNAGYMVERSALPVYGNVVKWIQSSQVNQQPELGDSMQTFVFSEPEINWKVRFKEDRDNKVFRVKRNRDENYFEIMQGREKLKEQLVPFVTNGIGSALQLLKDTVGKDIKAVFQTTPQALQTIYSQPADSLFKPMMYHSDNFFAEQVLLMASNKKIGVMNDAKMIDTLLKNELKALPQKPNWVDGSGLSRYNLFTPQDFVWLLNTMKEEFGLQRLKNILPTGGQGTLANYYKADSNYIYAKTGTLSGHVALSGFLITSKNKLLTFSILVNNHQSNATTIRRAVESFLMEIRKKY